MKTMKIILVAIAVMPLAVAAQRAHVDKADTLKNTKNVAGSSRILRFEQMDQRKIYHWGNGQRSTAAGREAGENIPDRVRLIGNDSAVVVYGSLRNAGR